MLKEYTEWHLKNLRFVELSCAGGIKTLFKVKKCCR